MSFFSPRSCRFQIVQCRAKSRKHVAELENWDYGWIIFTFNVEPICLPMSRRTCPISHQTPAAHESPRGAAHEEEFDCRVGRV